VNSDGSKQEEMPAEDGGQQPVVAMKGSRMTVPETGSEGKTATSEGA